MPPMMDILSELNWPICEKPQPSAYRVYAPAASVQLDGSSALACVLLGLHLYKCSIHGLV
eukprot:1159610-Pelagomonas_calceolata.AAC.6